MIGEYEMTKSLKYLLFSFAVMLFAAFAVAMMITTVSDTFETEAATKMITDADIQAIKDKIKTNEKKIGEYQDKINALKGDIQNAYNTKEELDQQINYMESNIEDTQLLIEQYAALIKEKEQQISEREGDVNSEYGDFLERLRVSYMSGTKNYMELIVSSDDLGDFMTRAENLGSLLSYEQSLMEQLDREISDLEKMKSSLEEKKQEYKDLGEYQLASKIELAKKVEEVENLIASLKKDEKAAEKARKAAEASDAALDKELEEMLKKQKEQQGAYVGGKFIWPLPTSNRTVTDTFGYRVSNGQYSSNHKGIDLAANKGTNIYAANSGTVITSTYSSSYGYYIVIDHGGGKASLYSHCCKLIAKKGETVKQGQVIAQVGMTGTATGYHLHFEIRINGVAVDPFSTGLLVMEVNGKYVDPYKEKILKASGCTLYK